MAGHSIEGVAIGVAVAWNTPDKEVEGLLYKNNVGLIFCVSRMVSVRIFFFLTF